MKFRPGFSILGTIVLFVTTILFVGCEQNRQFAQSDADQMIFRIAEIEVHPQYLDDYIQAASAISTASIQNEPGVISLIPMQIKDEPNKIRILEIYANQEAYQHHISTEHFKTYKQGTLHMVKDLKLIDTKAMNPAILPDILNRL